MDEWIDTPESSSIAGFGYNEDNQTLTVEFKNGTRYNYYDVPSHVYENMKNAPSYGKFLNSEIKGAYRYARQ